MNKRRLRPQLVVTFSAASAALGCTNEPKPPPLPGNPPALVPSATATTAATPSAVAPKTRATRTVAPRPSSTAKIVWSDFPTSRNPKDANGRDVFLASNGVTCYVERPDKNPHDAPPGMMASEMVACPPAMDDPAWGDCHGGQIRAKTDGSECICTVNGNPPPPHHRVACPGKA